MICSESWTKPSLPGGRQVKNPAIAEDVGNMCSIPGSGRSPEEEMATGSSILAGRIPWTEGPGRLQSVGLQRIGKDWATSTHTHMNKTKIWPQDDWPFASLMTIRATLTGEYFSCFSNDDGAEVLTRIMFGVCMWECILALDFKGHKYLEFGEENQLWGFSAAHCKTWGQKWGKGGLS